MKRFVERCGSTVLAAACYWASSHCILGHKYDRVSGVKSQPFIVVVGL